MCLHTTNLYIGIELLSTGWMWVSVNEVDDHKSDGEWGHGHTKINSSYQYNMTQIWVLHRASNAPKLRSGSYNMCTTCVPMQICLPLPSNQKANCQLQDGCWWPWSMHVVYWWNGVVDEISSCMALTGMISTMHLMHTAPIIKAL